MMLFFFFIGAYLILSYIFLIPTAMREGEPASLLAFLRAIPSLWYLKLPVAAMFTGVVSLLPTYSLKNIKSKNLGDGQYGDARWATNEEIHKTYEVVRTYKEKHPGFVVGRTESGQWIVDGTDINELLIGPPGCGKTTRVIVPTVEYNAIVNQNTGGKGASMIVTDIKGEVLKCTDPNMLLELEERLRTAVYLGEDGVPTNFILQSFSKNLEKEHIKFVIKELKPQFKEFRPQLYRHLCGALASGNPAAARILKAYSRDASGAAQMQELLQALSCKAYNFMAEKEKLYEAVFTQLQKRGVQLPESEYREVLENLFYRKGDSDYDTLFMRELVEGVLDNQSEIIRHQHDMLCGQFAKSLFHTLARMLNSQAQNANRTQPVKAPAFKAKQQFCNRRQFRAQGFEQDDSFSY